MYPYVISKLYWCLQYPSYFLMAQLLIITDQFALAIPRQLLLLVITWIPAFGVFIFVFANFVTLYMWCCNIMLVSQSVVKTMDSWLPDCVSTSSWCLGIHVHSYNIKRFCFPWRMAFLFCRASSVGWITMSIKHQWDPLRPAIYFLLTFPWW